MTGQTGKLRKTALAGIFAALVFLASYVIAIKTPTHGYVNMGDAMVMVAACFLGPWYGACAAGIGSALSDILGGYAVYVPASLLIKALMAMIIAGIWNLCERHPKKRSELTVAILAGIPAELVMVAGYFLYECVLFQNAGTAALSIPGNAVQAVFGVAAGSVLCRALSGIRKKIV